MPKQTEIEKCTIYNRKADNTCIIKCKLGLWKVEGDYGLEVINEASLLFDKHKVNGDYDELLKSHAYFLPPISQV